MIKSVKDLDMYMQSHGYSYIRSQFRHNNEEYVREYIHENGISTLRYENQCGTWENCFQTIRKLTL